jgi:hypothetical protein
MLLSYGTWVEGRAGAVLPVGNRTARDGTEMEGKIQGSWPVTGIPMALGQDRRGETATVHFG